MDYPEEECNDPENQECQVSHDYKKSLGGMFLVVYQNRERFDLNDYENDSPIRKESIVTWTAIPQRTIL